MSNNANDVKYLYYLPDREGNEIEYETTTNSVIIVGANGAGKSKLGAWIEQKDWKNVHRIGAQRNLNFNQNIHLKSYSEAEETVLYGGPNRSDKELRWDWGKYTTRLLNDFEDVLAALIASQNNAANDYIDLCRKCDVNGNPKPPVPITPKDKLLDVWSTIFPQRTLILEDCQFFANLDADKYAATEMSDGERAVLYLASQVLCVPENKILIIDEPEVHLHRSIMNSLWTKLEKMRPDCLFIYITHDTQFAAAHMNCDKFWVKSYDGKIWEYEKLEKTGLPEDLLLNVLGSRKKVIFVEGDPSSWDTQLYSIYYSNYLIVPCGSCLQVVNRTKAFNACKYIHEYEAYGIIDRDFRSPYEINKYKSEGIYTLDVAEVENLFIVEELIRYVAKRIGKNDDEIFQKVEHFVIDTKFKNLINRQVCESVSAEIKYRMSVANISDDSEENIKSSLKKSFEEIDFECIKKDKETFFSNALDSRDYAVIIGAFNHKGLSKGIEKQVGLNDYCKCVVEMFSGACKDDIALILKKYLPKEIPVK